MDDSAWLYVGLWWVAFAGSHLVLSSRPVRSALVARLGEQPFLGVYSVVALVTFIGLVVAYWGNQHTGPVLWSFLGHPAANAVGAVLGTLAFALLVASFAQPSASGMDPRATTTARGVTRVTRHPLFVAFALWGLAHVLINGFLSDLAFFGGFVVFAIVGAAHQDARKRCEPDGRYAEYCRQTSFWPFVAIASGRNRLVWAELPWATLAIGAAAGVMLYLLHPHLFA